VNKGRKEVEGSFSPSLSLPLSLSLSLYLSLPLSFTLFLSLSLLSWFKAQIQLCDNFREFNGWGAILPSVVVLIVYLCKWVSIKGCVCVKHSERESVCVSEREREREAFGFCTSYLRKFVLLLLPIIRILHP